MFHGFLPFVIGEEVTSLIAAEVAFEETRFGAGEVHNDSSVDVEAEQFSAEFQVLAQQHGHAFG